MNIELWEQVAKNLAYKIVEIMNKETHDLEKDIIDYINSREKEIDRPTILQLGFACEFINENELLSLEKYKILKSWFEKFPNMIADLGDFLTKTPSVQFVLKKGERIHDKN